MIILDTNQLERAQPPDGPLTAMLEMLSRHTGHRLWLPELVFEEHLAHYRRDVEGAAKRRSTVDSELNRLIPNLRRQEQAPVNVGNAVRDRAQRLQQIFLVRKTPDNVASESLLREARRQAPAKTSPDGPGSGARDVAIWLTAVSACQEDAEEVYFVAMDINAFGKEVLKAELTREIDLKLGVRAGDFRYCYGLDILLSALAAPHENPPEADAILTNLRVKAAVASSLSDPEVFSQIVNAAGLHGFGSVISLVPGISIRPVDNSAGQVLAYRIEGTTWASARPTWLAIRRVEVAPNGSWRDRFTVEIRFKVATTVVIEINNTGEIVAAEVTARGGIFNVLGVGIIPPSSDIEMETKDIAEDEAAATVERDA